MNLVLITIISGAFSFGSEFGLGADYSSQTYKIVSYDTLNWEEKDTLNIDTQGRGFLSLDMNSSKAKTNIDARNTLNFSTCSVRDQLNLKLEQQLTPALGIVASNDAELRYYHGLFPKIADTAYTEDFLNNVGRVEFRLDASEATSFTIADQAELLRYADPDSFSYDYLVNRLTADANQELGMFTLLNAEYGWSRRLAKAQEERNYNEHSVNAGIDHYFRSGFHLAGQNNLTRRIYPGAEHSFWQEDLTLSTGQEFTGFGLTIEDEGGWTWYDSTTETYTDLFENETRFTGEIQPRPELTIRLGPQYELGLALAGSPDDNYREWSLVLGLDFFQLDRLWVTFEDRIGRRNYPNADSAFQSSYTFNELSLFLNWAIISSPTSQLNLEGIANITPEWHTEKSDNFTMKVYTLELKYGF
ncbi:hypothetical protein CH330_06160 [candidate division WOR-3 bacterium JGI_Cruoil_03_51_56]|uniref:Uncharacterized protein n=1 Tax=candidate division WOR-3 bacterium JGI_Cruoil_03_51_56 TaxID=1973747 RepID=A0A235BU37_UNCW3|nr:MAG: hypothetical protein CH330_06160 [candidate division WOR-3 bacterium JGI_Cruoil_03_51_56]